MILLAVAACGGSPNDVNEKSKALVPYPHSRDVKLSKVNGSIQLEYWVDEAYPGPVAIGWISKNLTDNGWEKLPGSYFNPQVKSVNPNDWVKVIDARGSEENVVYQSSSDWKDHQNNVLVYGFEYRYLRHSQANLQRMQVRAILIPSDIAKSQLETGQKLLNNFK